MKNSLLRLFGFLAFAALIWFIVTTPAKRERPAKARVWTIDGQQITASYVNSTAQHVQLRVEGTQAVRVFPRSSLAAQDTEFIRRSERAFAFVKPASRQFRGRVTRVADGDSFVVAVDNSPVEIRMEGIDAPDYGQPFHRQAGDVLREYIQDRWVHLHQVDIDKYGRRVCQVTVGDVNLNAKMIELGYAWHYRAFSDNSRLAGLEHEARTHHRGLWSSPEPIPPWDWRKTKSPRGQRRSR